MFTPFVKKRRTYSTYKNAMKKLISIYIRRKILFHIIVRYWKISEADVKPLSCAFGDIFNAEKTSF